MFVLEDFMIKEFNTSKKTFGFLISVIITFLLAFILFYIKGFYDAIKFVLLYFLLYIVIYIYYFRDYKLIIDDEQIELFYLYTKPKSIKWTNIDKIEIEKETSGFSEFEVKTQLIHFYSNNKVCSFNISNIDKEAFLKTLISFCATYNIMIKEVNS